MSATFDSFGREECLPFLLGENRLVLLDTWTILESLFSALTELLARKYPIIFCFRIPKIHIIAIEVSNRVLEKVARTFFAK